jgi:Zn-dependent protease/predicted transcriptional regulator
VFNLPSLRIGRFFGIPIEVNISWLVIFFLIAGLLAFSVFPAVDGFRQAGPAVTIVAGIVTALLFFISVLLHEMSHSLVARSLGIRIESVTLFLFGGVARMEKEPDGPRDEFVMAIAGPAMSILLAALFWAGWEAVFLLGGPEVLWAPMQYLSLVNLSVGLFNMLPGFPLDGGRVLRAALWGITGDLLKATRWASRAGQVIGYSFVGLAVFGVFTNGFGSGSAFDLLWFGVLGWFLAGLAGASYREQVVRSRLASVTVDQIASRPAVVVGGDLTIEQIVVEHMIGGRHSTYPVVVDGQLAGILSLEHAKALPRDRWDHATAAELAEGDLRSIVVPYSANLEDALHRLEPGHAGMLVLERDGMLDGVVTRADVLEVVRRISLRSAERG